jgi:mannan endo-1,4-beta-mannosidase
VARGAPYFVTEHGDPWTPVGQNDAITWPELAGLFRRRDPAGVEAHLRRLRESGVTVLRLMLEYAHREHRYLERPVGVFQPNMVRLWDDLFAVCERVGMRILLTPFDTFFTWIRWEKHPYNRRNGGPCADRSQLLVCPATREAMKRRLEFATERWGGSGVLFAWDLWNEFHPAQADNRFDEFHGIIADLSRSLRATEVRLHGRAHPQTVSVFGPELVWKPAMVDPILRHPDLDFANSHFYEQGTIDDPRDTVAPAVSAGRLTRAALAEIRDGRPFFESEHGPIHTFKDRHRTLPEPFDDEYFRHIQWAHFASGGAGGGMRWPNRHPHVLTAGMRRAQRALSGFLPLIGWTTFRRRNLNEELESSSPALAGFACGDDAQAVVWLLRRDTVGGDGRLRPDAEPLRARVRVPGLGPGRYRATAWDTVAGRARGACEFETEPDGGLLLRLPPITTDLAVAVRRA